MHTNESITGIEFFYFITSDSWSIQELEIIFQKKIKKLKYDRNENLGGKCYYILLKCMFFALWEKHFPSQIHNFHEICPTCIHLIFPCSSTWPRRAGAVSVKEQKWLFRRTCCLSCDTVCNVISITHVYGLLPRSFNNHSCFVFVF